MTRCKTQRMIAYFGGKISSAHRYTSPGADQPIVEPFAGGAGYALFHAASNIARRVVLVERNQQVAALWRWLIQAEPSDVLGLPVTFEPGTDIRDVIGAGPGADLVARFQRVGAFREHAGGYLASRHTGRDGGMWGPRTRAKIADQMKLIRNWEVICGDYTASPDIYALWFVDPPYQRFPLSNYSGTAPIDFYRLGEWCRSRCGDVVVCEAANVDGSEPDWLPFERLPGTTCAGVGTRCGREGGRPRFRDTKRVWAG